MNIETTSLFTPPLPPIPEVDPGLFRFFGAVRRNGLQIWPRSAYEQDFVVNGGFGRKRFLLNAPKAIHRVLVENPSNYARTPASIRILRPITGNGLLLSEGEDGRHQRRTIAPALAPRTMPVLMRHMAGAAQETIARLTAMTERGETVDLLSAMQMLAFEIAARSMFSLEIHRHGAALRRMITQFAIRLGRPYFFDLMMPVTIPTLHDLLRMRFRRRWIALRIVVSPSAAIACTPDSHITAVNAKSLPLIRGPACCVMTIIPPAPAPTCRVPDCTTR